MYPKICRTEVERYLWIMTQDRNKGSAKYHAATFYCIEVILHVKMMFFESLVCLK